LSRLRRPPFVSNIETLVLDIRPYSRYIIAKGPIYQLTGDKLCAFMYLVEAERTSHA